MGERTGEIGAQVLAPLVGKRHLLEQTYLEMRPRLIATCRPIAGDDVEDVVHDSYVRARTRLHQLRDANQVGPWLMRIALNECFTRRRRARRFLDLLPRIPAQASGTSDPDVRAAVERLPSRERTLVVLHYGYGLQITEIADLLSLHEPTARSLLFRARRKIRSALEGDPPSPGGG